MDDENWQKIEQNVVKMRLVLIDRSHFLSDNFLKGVDITFF